MKEYKCQPSTEALSELSIGLWWTWQTVLEQHKASALSDMNNCILYTHLQQSHELSVHKGGTVGHMQAYQADGGGLTVLERFTCLTANLCGEVLAVALFNS